MEKGKPAVTVKALAPWMSIFSDGCEFTVKREHALRSGTGKAMLSRSGQFAENGTNEVSLREIPSHVLSKPRM